MYVGGGGVQGNNMLYMSSTEGMMTAGSSLHTAGILFIFVFRFFFSREKKKLQYVIYKREKQNKIEK